MSGSRSTSWRRFFVTTLLWSLALLLLTNIGWSVWFCTKFPKAYSEQWHRQAQRISVRAPTRIESNGLCQASIYFDDSSRDRYGWFSRYDTYTTPEGEGVDYRGLRASGLIEYEVPGWVRPRRLQTKTALTTGDHEWEMFVGVGWPWSLLWCRWNHVRGDMVADSATAIVLDHTSQLGSHAVNGPLPFRPILAGQMVYGGFCLTMVCFVRWACAAIRRRRRLRRDLCPSCAYSLHGNTSGVCPECGATVSANRSP